MMTKRIGLTGGIACGKSEVTQRLLQQGVPVLDSDHVAHQLLEPGNPVHKEVVRHFGEEILDECGGVNRQKLGKIVFEDPEQLEKLNTLMHPEICRRWREWFLQQRTQIAVVAIPLLFEVGVEDDFDGILCVWAPEKIMVERLKKRNLTEKEALLRIRAQMPVDLKVEKSTWTLTNNQSIPALHQQVDAWVHQWIR